MDSEPKRLYHPLPVGAPRARRLSCCSCSQAGRLSAVLHQGAHRVPHWHTAARPLPALCPPAPPRTHAQVLHVTAVLAKDKKRSGFVEVPCYRVKRRTGLNYIASFQVCSVPPLLPPLTLPMALPALPRAPGPGPCK